MCQFSHGVQSFERLETIFGTEYDGLLALGERVITLERHFNNQRGLDRDADSLPYEPPGFDEALNAYYDAHAWIVRTVPADRVPGNDGAALADDWRHPRASFDANV
ncbi:aldehyde ferredoxin oxidoreductase C-terminal domain-containing protein (plasmid) [Natronosalvus halobius]|nr:aldehyde ferredoxin oxidoreductase C-terminal domain-containing protein [Natronosalvus halobius]